jgi:hypothetical protein
VDALASVILTRLRNDTKGTNLAKNAPDSFETLMINAVKHTHTHNDMISQAYIRDISDYVAGDIDMRAVVVLKLSARV